MNSPAFIGSQEAAAAASVCPQNRAYGSVHGSSRNTYSILKPIYSPFAQFYPRFVRLWQDIFICHGNTHTHNENRTGRRHSAAISADGQDEYSCVAGQAFSDARELAGAQFGTNRSRVADLYPERRRSSFELCTGLGGGNTDDIDSLSESGRLARIGF